MLYPPYGIELSDYVNAIKAGNQTHVKINFRDPNFTLGDEAVAIDGGVMLTQMLNSETDLTFGLTISNECIIYLIGDALPDGFDYTKNFYLFFGVEMNGETQYVTVGYFHGKAMKKVAGTKNIYELTATDNMGKFDIIADEYLDSITYPATTAEIYYGLCNYVGVGYVQAGPDVLSDVYGYTFTKDIFTRGITCRKLLSYIAEACGTNAVFGSSDTVYLKNYRSVVNYELTEDDYYNIEIDDTAPSPIDIIKVSYSDTNIPDEIYPSGSTGNTYQFLDNPFLKNMDTATKSHWATLFAEQINDHIEDNPMKVDAIANWLVECGDMIRVYYNDGESAVIPVYRRTFTWACGGDDVYEYTGNGIRNNMNDSIAQQYKIGGELSEKYTINDSVEIDDNGITADKYLGDGVKNNLTTTAAGYVLDARQGKAIVDVRKIKTYYSVTQLGLESGSATMLSIWNKMPAGSMAIFQVSELVSAEQPYTYATIIAMKVSNARGYIRAISKDGNHEWWMGLYANTYNGNNSNAPSGVWNKYPETYKYSSDSSGATLEHTFLSNGPFTVRTYRSGTTQTSAFGLWTGYAGSSNSVLVPVLSPSAGVSLSISGLTLTCTTSATNIGMIVEEQ